MKRIIKPVTYLSLLLMLIIGFSMVGCSNSDPTTTSSAPAATSSDPTTTTSAPKTLKIAQNLALNWPIGLDTLHLVQLDVEKVNANGGLDIGGTKYIIDMVWDDHKMDDALAKTNAQKELFEDKVDFILGDLWCVPSYISLIESNDVVFLAWPATDLLRDPALNNVYHTSINDTNFLSALAYVVEKYPDLKTFVCAMPDDEQGIGYAKKHSEAAENCGLTVLDAIIYPPNATDLSAVGTKIKSLNPDIIDPHGGGPQGDSQVFKAAYDAGWRGQAVGVATMPGQTLLGIAGDEPLEGMLALGWPAEFEPATHPLAAEMKADYIVEYGEWIDPEECGAVQWWILKAALQQAGSIDPAAVRAVLDNGMKFDTIGGIGQMISRPDYGVSRTMEMLLGDMPIKKIVGGEVLLHEVLSIEESLRLFKIAKGID